MKTMLLTCYFLYMKCKITYSLQNIEANCHEEAYH